MRHEEWLPSDQPPNRRRTGAFLRRALTVVVCFSLGVVLAAGALLWQRRHELVAQRISVENLGEPPASEHASEAGGLGEAKTILVVGDDTSEGLAQKYRSLATGDRAGHRTDTIMMLRVDPEHNRVTGINFPRDLYVTLCNGGSDKMNAAWQAGGADCLVETVRDFAGVRIDHYVQVNIQGFVEIVEAVGGVTMYIKEPMNDPKAHLELAKGCQTLDGAQALGFVRTRADVTGDFGRIARQQRFLKELVDEATSMGVVTNPVRLFQMVEAVGQMVTVDDGMSLSTMRDFAMTLRNVSSDKITMATVPTTSSNSTGIWYEHAIEDETHDMLRAFKRGELAQYLGEAPDDAPSEPRPEPKIPLDELEPIRVLNASDVNQLAADTAEVLADAGVAIAGTSDADRPEPARVEIVYPRPMKRQAAALKVGAFPDAVTRRDRDAERVTVVLNGDFDPDLMDVVAAEDSAPEPAATEEREFTNAEPVEKKDC